MTGKWSRWEWAPASSRKPRRWRPRSCPGGSTSPSARAGTTAGCGAPACTDTAFGTFGFDLDGGEALTRSARFAREWSGAGPEAEEMLARVKALRDQRPLRGWEDRTRRVFVIGDAAATT